MAEDAKNTKPAAGAASGGDREEVLYRDLVQAPSEFEEGFNIRTFIGVLFVAVIMMPTAIYLGLTMGLGLGPAAEWVTIILFADIARRSFKPLKRQEIYMLYYVAAGLMTFVGGLALSGGHFSWMIWKQYLANTPFAQEMGIYPFPQWFVPRADSPAMTGRNFLHPDWVRPTLIMVATTVFGRVAWITMGYSLFRMTSDVEKLPFPMATIASEGATALAESSEEGESWRWRIFSVGAMIGMAFGAIYSLVPMLTKAFFGETVQLLPIPWIDTTVQTEGILPAAETGLVTNLGEVIYGMVLPFWLVAGFFMASMTHMFINPLLHELGVLVHWRPGMDIIMTDFMNRVDFWMSFSIGTSLAVASLGIYRAVKSVRKAQRERAAGVAKGGWDDVPPTRGDFSVKLGLGIFGAGSLGIVILSWYLITHPDYPSGTGGFPFEKQAGYVKYMLPLIIFSFAFIYTPAMSYVNARMYGLTGKPINFPMIREATFILSGYRGSAIWCAPFPMRDYGAAAQRFREIELTGTRFTSIIKAEICIYPITFVASLAFWQYIWHYGDPIPSPTYPFAQKMWQLHALKQCLMWSATSGGESLFFLAFKPRLVVLGFGLGIGTFALLTVLKAPMLLFYGYVGGLGYLPHFGIPEFIGALLGRYYFAKLVGRERWRRYVPVLSAGFFCGVGLISMVGVAFMLLRGCITPKPYLISPG